MIHGTSTGSAAWLLVSLAVTVGGLGSVLTTVGEPIAKARQGRGTGNRDQDRRARFTHDGTVDDEHGNGKKGNPDEAATGFDNLTNGFDLQGSSFESLTADRTCCAEILQRQSIRLRGGRDDGRWSGTDLQRAELPGVSPERRDRRRKPGHRTTSGTPVGRRLLRVARRLADSITRHPSGCGRARRRRRQHPHVPDFHQYSGTRIRRGHLELDAYGNPRPPASEHARIDRHRAGAGSEPGERSRPPCRPATRCSRRLDAQRAT